MPEAGVSLVPRDQILTFEEIERLVRIFADGGVTKIRLTGGEPLVRKDVELLASRLGEIEGIREFGLTTNGLLLDRKLDGLRSAGVNRLNISLDTLRPDRFELITRRPGLDRVLAAIDNAVKNGFDPVKVNCVVMKGVNDDELPDFVRMTEKRSIDVRFIEYMPFSDNGWNDGQFIPYRDMLSRIRRVFPDLRPVALDPAATAKVYEVPGFLGRVGFITSMSENFCSGCTRLRLTADGFLKVCLFGAHEISLRDALRTNATDPEMRELIQRAVRRKKASHAGMHEIARTPNRPMILIGG
jgi:cyclic pyranopterin phosphate synthase